MAVRLPISVDFVVAHRDGVLHAVAPMDTTRRGGTERHRRPIWRKRFRSLCGVPLRELLIFDVLDETGTVVGQCVGIWPLLVRETPYERCSECHALGSPKRPSRGPHIVMAVAA